MLKTRAHLVFSTRIIPLLHLAMPKASSRSSLPLRHPLPSSVIKKTLHAKNTVSNRSRCRLEAEHLEQPPFNYYILQFLHPLIL